MIPAGSRFGGLTLVEDCPYKSGSKKKVGWLCDCGRTLQAVVKNVTGGGSSSCGRCNEISAEEMAVRRFGRLRMREPAAVSPHSHRRVGWLCDCGKETVAIINDVFSGKTVSCRRCNEVSAEEMAARRFGRLRMRDPSAVTSGSTKKVWWMCDCGKESLVTIASVFAGLTTSCNRCNEATKDETEGVFGRLRLDVPRAINRGSNLKTTWSCACGNKAEVEPHRVFSGLTGSCGRCYLKAREWWSSNQETIRSLKCPVDPSSIPGPFRALDVILATKHPFRAVCMACGREYFPLWENIRQGRSVTCGCSYGKISSLNLLVRDIVTSSGLEAELEHEVGGLAYDVFVPSRNLLIEVNGLRWHSMPGAREVDRRKYENALAHGHDFMMLFEDEVRRPFLPDLIRNRIGAVRPVSLRPSRCEVRRVRSAESSPFYGLRHYIGPCRARVHYGVFNGAEMVACASFSTPTRQNSAHPWELVRMASDPRFRIHGIWGHIMAVFVRDFRPSSVVSFSENRLFGGSVYEKIGFRHDGDIRPDYSWTDGRRRYHKSGLRKRGDERNSGLTEAQLRESEGYRKVWDLGKKRWVWCSIRK